MASSEQTAASVNWPSQLTRLPVWFLAVVVGLLSLAVVYLELPGRPLIWHSLQKLGHPLVFGLVTLGLFGIRRQRRPLGNPFGDYVPTCLVALTLGFFTEASQVVTHRDPALKDLMLDVRGITCALALLAAFDPRLLHGKPGARARKWFLAAAILVIALTLAPLGWVTMAYVNRAVTAPTLFAPRYSLDLLLVSLTDMSPELAELPTAFTRGKSEKALRVPLTNRPYAGVTLDEPLADWRGYHVLVIDVTNPGRPELPLHVRVQDRRHDGNYADRYEGLIVLPPSSRQRVEIPLSEIEKGPRGRPLDLGQISTVTLYKVGAEGSRELWLSRIDIR